ncbi:MAG: glycoside hydrolase family 3 protein [Vicinamibacterales bacterium]
MHVQPLATRVIALLVAVWTGALLASSAARPDLDPDARVWVDATLAKMTLDEKIGQLLLPSFYAVYTSSDSQTYADLTDLIHAYHVGGFHVFGAREARPNVLLNPTYSRTSLGQPLNAASLINRLQAIAAVPLLITADFEAGIGFRLTGGTTFPRAMAFGAAGDRQLAYEAGRITASEARAIGVHVNFAPVVDVNDNPRNPVINTRSFGEDPTRVGELAAAYVAGLQAGGMLATIKHFPGHGNTDVDSHLGLPIITHTRARLDRVELPPFRAAIAAGVDGVMTAHIVLPELESSDTTPTTFSGRIVDELLRGEIGFDGLVFTDSMRMRAISDLETPSEAATRAVMAGHDVILHSPDDRAAFRGLQEAVQQGVLPRGRIDQSVERILSAKARLGLHRTRAVSLDTLPVVVGTRANAAVAREVSERSLTLIKDDFNHLPLPTPRGGAVLYLSVLDYPSGWGLGAPSRTLIPELEKRWADVTAIELSDRTPLSEIELVRETAPRYDAVIAGVFVRTASFSGRMDLSDALVTLLRQLGRDARATGQPFVTVFFGNPYAATFLTELPTMLLTYDFYDLAEASVARALAGESAVGGRLPVALGDRFPVGHGLERAPRR